MSDVVTSDRTVFTLTGGEREILQTLPEALEELADWYDFDAASAEACGATECVKHDEKRAQELRAHANELRSKRSLLSDKGRRARCARYE